MWSWGAWILSGTEQLFVQPRWLSVFLLGALLFIRKGLFLSQSVWQWFQHCLIYNKNKMEKDAATDKATEIPCTDIFFCRCNLTASALATLKLFWKVLLSAQPELFTDRKNKFCFLSLLLSLPSYVFLQIYPAMDMDSASSVVLQALTQATSQDTAVLKPAEEQLRQWETQPGFYSVLLVRGWYQRREIKSTSKPLKRINKDLNAVFCWKLDATGFNLSAETYHFRASLFSDGWKYFSLH